MRRMSGGELVLGVHCLWKEQTVRNNVYLGGKIKRTHTEGNGEVNVTDKRKVGSVGTLGLDELEEGVGSLGCSVGDYFRGNGGRGRQRVSWVPEARAVEGAVID
jgi:hypothetical protein